MLHEMQCYQCYLLCPMYMHKYINESILGSWFIPKLVSNVRLLE